MKSPLFQILFGVFIAFSLLRLLAGSQIGRLVIWVLVVSAVVVCVTVWMLRNRRETMSKLYTRPGCRQVIDVVCKLTNEQPPPPMRKEGDGEQEAPNLRLRTEADVGALRQHVLGRVHGFDSVTEDIVERLWRNLTMRRGAEESADLRPLGVFLVASPAGSGRRYLAEHFAVGLYNRGSSVCYDLRAFSSPGAASVFTAGTKERNSLVAQVVATPECTIILENLSKASADIWSFLQGVFTNGVVTDPDKGVPVRFRDTVFFLLEPIEAAGKPQRAPHQNPVQPSEAAAKEFGIPNAFLSTVDRVYRLPWVSYDAAAEVVLDLMERECGKFNIELEHVEADVVVGAAKYFAEQGFETAPAWVAKQLESPLHDAVAHGQKSLRVS